MAPPAISGSLTRLQCCPIGEGAAALLVASDDAITRLGIDRSRAVRVLASVQRTERVYRDAPNFDAELTRETVEQAYAEAGVEPNDLDVVELHDAFTIEELLYLEAMGVCEPGRAVASLLGGRLRHRRPRRRQPVRRTAGDGPSDRPHRRGPGGRDHATATRRGGPAPARRRARRPRAHGRRRRRVRGAHPYPVIGDRLLIRRRKSNLSPISA